MYKRAVSDNLSKVNAQKNNSAIVLFNVVLRISYVNLIALQSKFVSKI